MSNKRAPQGDDLSAVHEFLVLSRAQQEILDQGYTIYLTLIYHSSVFTAPAQAYQMAMLVSLPEDVANALNADFDRYGDNGLLASGGTMRILQSTQALTLQGIADAAPTMDTPYDFQAVLERKGASESVAFGPARFMASVRKILYFRQLDPDAQVPSESKFIFLSSPDGACHVAHYLTRRPDFDSIQTGDNYPPWGDAPGEAWDDKNRFLEVLLPAVPPYQGGALPTQSPLAVGQSDSFVRVFDSSTVEQTIHQSAWFDTTTINGDNPVDSQIVSVAIYPGIGVARIGNSDEYFIGPEVPTPVAQEQGFYRDQNGALKRQAARFRVYGLDANGNVVREITAADGKITWTVQVANKKASWYQFGVALDLPESLPVARRNALIKGDDRKKLEITPDPASIAGAGQTDFAAHQLAGQFFGRPVVLAELGTDEAGRLIFLGGRGQSIPAVDGGRAYTYGNNDGFCDDTCDGVIQATVSLDGQTLQAKPAWVVVAPPNYAPDLKSMVTLYDILANTYTGQWWPQKARPSFTSDIYPILARFSETQWVNKGFAAQFGWKGPNYFPDQLDVLSAPGQEFAAQRRILFNQFRYPRRFNSKIRLTAPDNTDLSGGVSVAEWPSYYGDATAFSNPTSDAYMAVTELQYQYLWQWAIGDFDADWRGTPPAGPTSIDQVPVQDQPATLDRAAMEFCLGGPFHPGCEVTWPIRNYTMFTEPFRVRTWPDGVANQDYGDQLTPEQVYVQGRGATVGGPLYFNGPGDLTRWMAVPWQTDTASCRSGYVPEYDPYLPTFWPHRVPNHVLTEDAYQQIIAATTPEEAMAAFQGREVWYRWLGADDDYQGQLETMIQRFGDLGLIERRPGPTTVSNMPAELYVETGVQFAGPALLTVPHNASARPLVGYPHKRED